MSTTSFKRIRKHVQIRYNTHVCNLPQRSKNLALQTCAVFTIMIFLYQVFYTEFVNTTNTPGMAKGIGKKKPQRTFLYQVFYTECILKRDCMLPKKQWRNCFAHFLYQIFYTDVTARAPKKSNASTAMRIFYTKYQYTTDVKHSIVTNRL